MGLSQLLRQAADRFSANIALVAGERSVTYRELDQAANGLACWFLAQGLCPGDRVAIHWTNSIETVELLLACVHAGLVAVPINTRLKPPEVGYILDRTRPRLCFSQPELASIAGEARGLCPWLPPILTDLPGPLSNGELPAPSPDAPALILYTSGTTARPKGVIHTHTTVLASARIMWDTGVDDTAVLVVAVPLMHASGLTGLALPSLMVGATLVLIPKFDPGAVLDAVQRHRCTFGFGLPAMMQFLAAEQQQRPRDVASLRTWVAGGDSVPVSLQERFLEVFGIPLQEGYAMTESLAITWNRRDAIRSGSLGRPALGVELQARGMDGSVLPYGQVGELAVRSAANFVGYWNDPKATAASLQDGWLLTGDLGRIDAEGYLWFAGRSKTVIIRGGSNIAPQEVEEVLYQHPAVLEVGVIGLPDVTYGESVVACAVLRDGQCVREEELREFTRRRLADYKVPERIVFLSAIPKGSTGKVQRDALKQMVLSGP